MTTKVDARGLACPQPVIQTRRAMQDADHVVTLVDNENAATNVRQMALSAGWEAQVTQEGTDLIVEMIRREAARQTVPETLGKAEFLAGPLVLALSGEKMGRGEAELGQVLMRSFFHTLTEVQPRPDAILLFNTAVKLACLESPVLDDLHTLEAGGVQVLACGTCLGHFGLKDKLAAGRISNMYEIAEMMLRAGKVVNL